MRSLCIALVALAVCTPTAVADVTRKKSMWGPASVDGVSQFPIYQDLGAGIWQASVSWADVATTRPVAPRDPTDPAYAWPPELDGAVADARRHGIAVSLMVMQTPGWANGGRGPRFAPTRAREFADFLAAAARRYPAVAYWLVWGEPTKASNFQPQGNRGARRYARMLDAGYAAIKSVQPRDRVIGGNTFTVGSTRPQPFIRAMKLPGGRPPRMDLFGHNAFTARRPVLSAPPLGRGYADFGDLDTLFGWLDRFQRRDGRRLKVFISEMSFPTDHANHEFNFWMTQDTQAQWIRDALAETRRTRRIFSFGYLGLYDDPVRPGGDQVERGLIARDGTRKPAYDAFRDG